MRRDLHLYDSRGLETAAADGERGLSSPVTDNNANLMLAAALKYAARGWHVFPLQPGIESPLE